MSEETIETVIDYNPVIPRRMSHILGIEKKKIIVALQNNTPKTVALPHSVKEILSDLEAPIGSVYIRLKHSHIKTLHTDVMRVSDNNPVVEQQFIKHVAKYFE